MRRLIYGFCLFGIIAWSALIWGNYTYHAVMLGPVIEQQNRELEAAWDAFDGAGPAPSLNSQSGSLLWGFRILGAIGNFVLWSIVIVPLGIIALLARPRDRVDLEGPRRRPITAHPD